MKRLLCFIAAVIFAGYGWCYYEKEGIHADAIPTVSKSTVTQNGVPISS